MNVVNTNKIYTKYEKELYFLRRSNRLGIEGEMANFLEIKVRQFTLLVVGPLREGGGVNPPDH